MASKNNLYLAALIACLTAALFGYSVGFIGGLLVLPSFLNHFHLDALTSTDLASAQARIVTAWLFGALLGVPLGIPICSNLGRRWCLRFSAGLYVLGAALQLILTDDVKVFEAGRFLNGVGVGCGTLVSPMFISEISPSADRGMLMSGYQTILQFAALLGFWGAYISHAIWPTTSTLQWQVPVAIQLVPGSLLLLGTFIIPETPRFLADKGKYHELANSLAWLRGTSTEDEDLKTEVDEINEAAISNRKLRAGTDGFWKEVGKSNVRRRLIVGVGLMVAQNMVGLNALNYYAPVIFMSAGFTSISSSLFLTGIFGLVKLITAILFMFYLVKTKGNIFWLKTGSIVCGVTMVILSYFVKTAQETPPNHESTITIGGVISVLMVYIFAFSFSVSLGPISWNVCSEIFPLHINAQCCAITTCTQWIFQIVIAAVTPRLLARIGWVTYLIYAFFSLLTYIFIKTTIPETRGIKIGTEMDALFDDKEMLPFVSHIHTPHINTSHIKTSYSTQDESNRDAGATNGGNGGDDSAERTPLLSEGYRSNTREGSYT